MSAIACHSTSDSGGAEPRTHSRDDPAARDHGSELRHQRNRRANPVSLVRVGSSVDEWCVLFIENHKPFYTAPIYTTLFHQQRSLLHTSSNIYCLSSLSYTASSFVSYIIKAWFVISFQHTYGSGPFYTLRTETAQDSGHLDLVAPLPQFDFYLVLITYASHKLKFQNTGKKMRHC